MDHTYDRERMVRRLREAGIRDERVLAAMREIPRHEFVPGDTGARAYRDFALPIGNGQTISAPSSVARMSELLEVRAEHSVLEIGTGLGYQTAVLATLARRVYSIERVHALAQGAIENIRRLGFHNVKIHVFDGTIGWSEAAPYDRIIVTAAAPMLPPPLLEQLAPDGRLLIPEGPAERQTLVLYQKDPWGNPTRRVGEEVSFVPLLGKHGFEDEG